MKKFFVVMASLMLAVFCMAAVSVNGPGVTPEAAQVMEAAFPAEAAFDAPSGAGAAAIGYSLAVYSECMAGLWIEAAAITEAPLLRGA